jgi:hypothetical protein
VDDAEVDLGPGGELLVTGPFEGGQRRLARPDRVGEPPKLSQGLHRAHPGLARLDGRLAQLRQPGGLVAQ